MSRHTHVVFDEGKESFYLVEENKMIGDVYYVRLANKCHWRPAESYGHKDGVAEAPFYGDMVIEYGDYVVGSTAFRTKREALIAAIKYSEKGLQRRLESKESFDAALQNLRNELTKVA
jgi:hypothetical protein